MREEGRRGVYDLAFVASMDLAYLHLHLPKNPADLLYPALSPFEACDALCQFEFHPLHAPASTARPVRGRSAVEKRSLSTASSEHNDSVALALKTTASADLKNHALIEYVDLTAAGSMEIVDLSGEPTLGSGGKEVLQAQSKVHCPWCRGAFSNEFQVPL